MSEEESSVEVCDEDNNGYSGQSIKELYFFDLAHTRELYKDFDLKIQVLYIMTKFAKYGIDINRIHRLLGLSGNVNHIRNRIKDALCFWNGCGYVSIIYDKSVGTMPSPMMWICDDKNGAEKLLSGVVSLHTQITGDAIKNRSLEKLVLSNTNTLYCISILKKTIRGV